MGDYVMDTHNPHNLEILMMIVKAIMENRVSGNLVRIWDGRILIATKNPITATSLKENTPTEIDDEKLRSYINKILIDENSFKISLKKNGFANDIEWSFKLTLNTVRNFIKNILIANIDRGKMSDDNFRELVRGTLSAELISSNISNLVINRIADSVNDINMNDRGFRKMVKRVLSRIKHI